MGSDNNTFSGFKSRSVTYVISQIGEEVNHYTNNRACVDIERERESHLRAISRS